MSEPLTAIKLIEITSNLARRETINGKFVLFVRPSVWGTYKAAKIMRANRAKRRRHD